MPAKFAQARPFRLFLQGMGVLAACLAPTAPALAADLVPLPVFTQPPPPPVEAGSFRFLDELRVGGFVSQGTRERGATSVNIEVLTSKVTTSDDPIESVLIPRLHVGTHISASGATNELYFGLTWKEDLLPEYLPGVFIEGSFGGVYHDGKTGYGALPEDRAALGCHVMFRESLSLGYRITDNLSIMATVDHISNGGLCGRNHGLNNYGGRIAYTF